MDPPHQKGAAGGATEGIRRINVVYFLSRGGRTDHPHLFRVNHHSRAAGVRLRDVKRWLSEIRGKDMPENFSWSYKRKYKAGYVWQDLKDDDLITPVSDNEFVLKGCDVRGTPPRAGCVQEPKTNYSLDKKERDDRDEKTRLERQADRAVEVELAPGDSDEDSPKPPPAADQDSPGGSGESSARQSTVLFKIEVSQALHHGRNQQRQEPPVKAVARVPQEQLLRRAGSKARGMRVERALHSILTCGAADDTAIRPVARRQRAAGDDWTMPTPTCPGMDGCGLRVSRKPRLRTGGKEQQARRDGRKRDGGDAHKPVALPRCSQCGKEFKPQELHSHMQSCRAFKERMKSSASTRLGVDRSRAFSVEGRSKPRQEHPRPASAVFLLTGS